MRRRKTVGYVRFSLRDGGFDPIVSVSQRKADIPPAGSAEFFETDRWFLMPTFDVRMHESGTSRQHEHAVRLALGASRGDLVRGQVVEAALVTMAGGLLAILVARALMASLLSADLRLGPGMTVAVSPELNLPVAALACASTLLALLVFGMVPALHATRTSVRDAIASDAQGAPLPRWRGRRRPSVA